MCRGVRQQVVSGNMSASDCSILLTTLLFSCPLSLNDWELNASEVKVARIQYALHLVLGITLPRLPSSYSWSFFD